MIAVLTPTIIIIFTRIVLVYKTKEQIAIYLSLQALLCFAFIIIVVTIDIRASAIFSSSYYYRKLFILVAAKPCV